MAVRRTIFGTEPVPFPVFEGVSYPSFIPFREKGAAAHIEDIVNFNSRGTDILLCACMKAGTHWTREILTLMLTGGKELSKERISSTMLEQVTNLSTLDELPSPRLLNTHVMFKYLPSKHIANGGKIVHVIRNPKDICVSLYNHGRHDIFFDLDIPWNDYFDMWMDDKVTYGSWYDYEGSFEQAQSEHPGLIYTLHYEDLQMNPSKEIIKLADFLSVPCSEDKANHISHITSFNNMAANKIDRTKLITTNGLGFIYRKGEIGDWKNWFTVSQNERFDEQFNRRMNGSSYRFKFSS